MSVKLAIHKWIEQKYSGKDTEIHKLYASIGGVKSKYLFITSCIAADVENRPRWAVSYGPTQVRISYREEKTREEWAKDHHDHCIRIAHQRLIKGITHPIKVTIVLKIGFIFYGDPDFFMKLDKALVRCRSMAVGQERGIEDRISDVLIQGGV